MKIFAVFLVITQVFLMLMCLNFRTRKQGARKANVERFDNTCGGRDALIILNYKEMKTEGKKLIFNGTITVKQDILMEVKILVNIDRCKNKENLDTCEHFLDSVIDDACDIIREENKVWSPVFRGFEPKLKCPIKKGIYRATNSVLDVSAFMMFPLEGQFWRVKAKMQDKATDKMICCAKGDAYISTE